VITAIDTNILLDLLIPDAPHAASSETLLDEAYQQGALIISETVYAELAARFPSPNELNRFLQTTGIRLEHSQPEALDAASQAWLTYNSQRGQGIQCPECGKVQSVNCSVCGTPMRLRQHVLADFLIGGHALKQSDRLLTRDRGYFRTYFPDLQLQE
jgi:predicted nucleic acid-binding protein